MEPSNEVSNAGQSFALPVLTTSVNWALPLSENANVLYGTIAIVMQNEMTKAKNERILIIKISIKFWICR